MTEATFPVSPLDKQPRFRDRFRLWPLGLVMAIPFAITLAWSISVEWLDFPDILLLDLAWAISAVVIAAVAVVMLAMRRWRHGLSLMIFPLATMVWLSFSYPWQIAHNLADILHFAVMRPRYAAQAANLPHDGGPRQAFFEWGVTGFAGLETVHGVAYDERDEILLDWIKRSPESRQRMEDLGFDCGITGLSFGDHFYIVWDLLGPDC
jgi:hypothetical protein